MAMINIASADTFSTRANQFTIDFVNISGDASSANGTNISQFRTFQSGYKAFIDPGDYRMVFPVNKSGTYMSYAK